ncbi:MAG: carbamoyl phosphate synthase small subunit [Clostridia bacterium]|nr:carbamoyl phosphate synthase small subunit [Clostridia bacterium]
MSKAYLILQNKQVFEGQRFGAAGEVTAELVFNTSVVGYIETLTDPCYHGQMVVQTFPLIGNYGIIESDYESEKPHLSAYIVRKWCDIPSNFRCEGTVDEYLKKTGVVGLCELDTRALTRIIREYGVMNAAIVDALPVDLDAFCAKLADAKTAGSVQEVTCKASYTANESGEKHVVVWNFGVCASMLKKLAALGCKLTVVPADTCAQDVLNLKPDGVFLSGGPGDPAACTEIIENIGQVVKTGVPTFGVGLGHQLLALSQGAKSYKLKYGHRGSNQPVRDTTNGYLYSTSQNNGYAICADSLPETALVRYENANDGVCEGIDYTNLPAFSVQFMPEAYFGPRDGGGQFDRFIALMGGK